jgi:hypothetical protein
MPREKSIAHRTDRITASFSSNASDDHESLGADQEQAPETQAATLDAGSSNAMLPRRERSFHNKIHLPISIRLSGRTTFQCKFVFPLHQHVNNLKKKLISSNILNFKFTNMKPPKS